MMIPLINLLDILATLATLAAILFLLSGRRGAIPRDMRLLLLVLAALLCLHNVSNIFEWTEITRFFDQTEDYLGILIPLAWLVFFYSFLQKLSRDNLATSREEYRILVEYQNELVVKLDAKGRFLFVSPSYCRTFGKTEKELLGRTFGQVVHEEDQERVKTAFRDVFQAPYLTRHEERALTREGWRWFSWVSRGIPDAAGRITAVLSVGRDITEAKNAEQERDRLIRELEAKKEEMERFIYTVSHDLKSPLVTVKGFAGMLKADIERGAREKICQDLEHINKATDKMKQLLDDLLEFSRVGRRDNPRTVFSLEELVEEVIALSEPRLQEKHVEVHVVGPLPRIRGDRARIFELYQNLVDNAIKYQGNSASPRIEIGMRPQGEEKVFYVKDNGIGIDPVYHEKVFQLFEKLETTQEGTGVGLSIAKRVVENHGGRIWVESPGRGGGSTFAFTLPQAILVEGDKGSEIDDEKEKNDGAGESNGARKGNPDIS